MTEVQLVTEINKVVGAVVASAGTIIVAPDGTAKLWMAIWGWL